MDKTKPTFAIVGYGRAGKRHEQAIRAIGGEVLSITDQAAGKLDPVHSAADYIVIATPSGDHAEQIERAIEHGGPEIIVEKPMCLPWQHVEDNDCINVVLQYRYAQLPPLRSIHVRFVRPPEYFAGWQGDYRQTGGLWYHLLIHYVDLAIQHRCELRFEIATSGEQDRRAFMLDGSPTWTLNNSITNAMTLADTYRAILKGEGIYPQDCRYLHWTLDRLAAKWGDGLDLIDHPMTLDFSDRMCPTSLAMSRAITNCKKEMAEVGK